jgi:hypothetical protein
LYPPKYQIWKLIGFCNDFPMASTYFAKISISFISLSVYQNSLANLPLLDIVAVLVNKIDV